MTDTDNLSRRRFLQATGGAASAVALAGCTGNDDTNQESTETTETTKTTTTDESSQVEVTDNFLRRTNSTMSTLDPIKATDTASGEVIQQVYDALMNYPNAKVEPKAQIAKDYEVSEDFKTYTFNLKEGVTFHDGSEVTAQDFVYSWERLAASSNSRRTYFILDSIGVTHETETVTKDGEEVEQYKPGTLGVTADGDYTLKVELSGAFHSTLPMLAYTSFAVIPEGIVGDIDGYEGKMSHKKFATKEAIGSGPFQFEVWSSNTECVVSKYDGYHGQKAKVDGIHWNISSSSDALYTYGIVNQNADIVTSFPTAKYDPNKVTVEKTDKLGRRIGTYGSTKSGATMQYEGVPTINSYYIGFNTDSVEKPIRQAAAYAMNQQTVIEEIFKGRGKASYHFTPPSIYPGGATKYKSHAEGSYPYGYNQQDLKSARKVMEDAGYGPDKKASFTFTAYESSDTWAELGKLLRDQLASAHIDMKVERAPFSTLLKRGRNGNLDAYSLGWVMDWPAPDNFLQLLNPPQTDTSKAAPTSYVNWSGTDASKKAADAWKTVQDNAAPTDSAQQARNEAYVQIEEANWEDVCFLPTYHKIEERFTYNWVDRPVFGGAGYSRQMLNDVSLSERSN